MFKQLETKMKVKHLSIVILIPFFLLACSQEKLIQSQLPPASDQNIQQAPEPRVNELSKISEHEYKVLEFDSNSALVSRKEAAIGHNKILPSAPLTAAQDVTLRSFQTQAITNTDKFADLSENGVVLVSEQPLSTFSIDVDTGAYSLVRKYLTQGQLPPANAVRSEELINYFKYHFAKPQQADHPFAISTEITRTPWNANTHLVQIGVQGYQQEARTRPAANLVFLIDVSGSMSDADKLPLLKNAFRLLVKQLTADDRITLVVYAGASGLVLEPTPGDHQADILNALEQLSAGGSTHGSAGIKLAYAMAQQSFIKQGINRVILATDGDFNVGTVNHEALLNLVERKKREGIALTTLGFGSGNYNDHLMEQLADHGDGNYAYIDNLSEARKVLVEQMDATLETIARDVKIQIEWNPDVVYEYRLIGYENRLLKREDFNNDKVDAGDIGAGHTVTALYEITLNQSSDKRIQPLHYQAQVKVKENFNELAMINIRYKKPDQDKSQLISQILKRDQVKQELSSASDDLRFAAAVAAYAEQLRGGEHLHEFDYDDILALARSARGRDEEGYRSAFLSLVALAQSLDS
jgi:Ca-activated chloride channel homolog